MGQAVLIIEDEATISKNLNTYLMRHGFEVRVAPTAEEGMAQLDVFKPDAILLDFNLPGMNGLEALTKLRTQAPDVRVIMITGHGNVELAVEAMKSGAYDFLTKPVSLGKLKLLLDRALGEERIEHTLSYYLEKDKKQHSLD